MILLFYQKFLEYVTEKFQKKEENVHLIPHGVFDYYKNFESNEKVIDYDSKNIIFYFWAHNKV